MQIESFDDLLRQPRGQGLWLVHQLAAKQGDTLVWTTHSSLTSLILKVVTATAIITASNEMVAFSSYFAEALRGHVAMFNTEASAMVHRGLICLFGAYTPPHALAREYIEMTA